MKLQCTLSQRSDGRWAIRHSGGDAGDVEVTAASRDEAMAKMRDELLYRLEFCACVANRYQDLEIELTEPSR
jgi:hypothetical protein